MTHAPQDLTAQLLDVYENSDEPASSDVALEAWRSITDLRKQVKKLKHERYDLAYAITGGEDAPGLLDSIPASELVKIARDNVIRHNADIDRLSSLTLQLAEAREALSGRPGNVPTSLSTSRVTVADYNAAFDPADEAFGGAFKDGFREGWLFGKDAAFEDREDLENDYQHVVDMAPTECWDAYREKYFSMLPLAALPVINDTTVEDSPVSSLSGIEEAIMDAIDDYRDSLPCTKYGPLEWPTVEGMKEAVRTGLRAALSATATEGE